MGFKGEYHILQNNSEAAPEFKYSEVLGHLKPLIFHLFQMENKWFLCVPIFKLNIVRL